MNIKVVTLLPGPAQDNGFGGSNRLGQSNGANSFGGSGGGFGGGGGGGGGGGESCLKS